MLIWVNISIIALGCCLKLQQSITLLKLLKTLISAYLLGLALICHSQNIESIAKGDVLKGAGTLSFNQIYNHTNGKIPSRNPYSYLLNGNINLQIFGFINAPFNFMYSNLGNQFTQPTFNQTSIHPNYKWMSTHFGSIACNYSPYTVSGHLFQGAAIDLTPGKFSFSTFYHIHLHIIVSVQNIKILT